MIQDHVLPTLAGNHFFQVRRFAQGRQATGGDPLVQRVPAGRDDGKGIIKRVVDCLLYTSRCV